MEPQGNYDPSIKLLTHGEYAELRTMTGKTPAEVSEILQRELEADAYQPVRNRDYLTDINPAYLLEALNECFGLAGIGWGYDYDHEMMIFGKVEWTSGIATKVTIKKFDFWYMAGSARWHIPSSGGSTNMEEEDAVKGAVTNCIGNAAAKLLWQIAVRKGKIEHAKPKKDRKQAKDKRSPRQRKQQAGQQGEQKAAPEKKSFSRQDLDNAENWALENDILPPAETGKEVEWRAHLRNWLDYSPLQPGFDVDEFRAFAVAYAYYRADGQDSATSMQWAIDTYETNLIEQREKSAEEAGQDGPGETEEAAEPAGEVAGEEAPDEPEPGGESSEDQPAEGPSDSE